MGKFFIFPKIIKKKINRERFFAADSLDSPIDHFVAFNKSSFIFLRTDEKNFHLHWARGTGGRKHVGKSSQSQLPQTYPAMDETQLPRDLNSLSANAIGHLRKQKTLLLLLLKPWRGSLTFIFTLMSLLTLSANLVDELFLVSERITPPGLAMKRAFRPDSHVSKLSRQSLDAPHVIT